MNSPKSKTNLGPSEVRGISDPPDMGRVQHAALKSLTEIADAYELAADEQEEQAGQAWAHEGSSERHAGKAEAFRGVAALLRARVKGISDPPDMGRMRPAEDVATEVVPDPRGDDGWRSLIGDSVDHVPLEVQDSQKGALLIVSDARGIVARLIRQSRAEGAAAALEETAARLEAKASGYSASASDAWAHEASSERYGGKFEAYDDAASILRARIKDISDPPDMG
jgi:hypothetical protein